LDGAADLPEFEQMTRTLLRADVDSDVDPRLDGRALDPVIAAALEEGRALCAKDGSLARVPRIVAQREELSRRLFETPPASATPAPAADSALAQWLPILAPLLPAHALAVDIGTGDGALLPLLSPLYDRVIAVAIRQTHRGGRNRDRRRRRAVAAAVAASAPAGCQ
jgi:ArsR family transcriptional regulator